jgi:pyridoxal 5'-phosphate synthase pdxT subunit
MTPEIGVLALQGDFEAHRKAIERSGAHALEVRTKADLESSDALILPGGESTTMLKLLDAEGLFEPLRSFGERKPIFGTCAGAILLAADVSHPRQRSLGLMDLSVERNGYGRQIDSRVAQIAVEGKSREAVFIRAPIIRRVGPSVKVLATYQDNPVLVAQGRHLAATFHPELSTGSAIHQYFIARILDEMERKKLSDTLEEQGEARIAK